MLLTPAIEERCVREAAWRDLLSTVEPESAARGDEAHARWMWARVVRKERGFRAALCCSSIIAALR